MRTDYSSPSENDDRGQDYDRDHGFVPPRAAEALTRQWLGEDISVDDGEVISDWRRDNHDYDKVETLLRDIWTRSERVSEVASYGKIDVNGVVLKNLHHQGWKGDKRERDSLKKGGFRYVNLTTVVMALGICMSLILFSNLEPFTGSTTTSYTSEYVTKRGETARIQLIDGSIVTLGPNSRLYYSDLESGSLRAVNLEGQGYFKIVHNPSRPFVVYTDNAAVQELGTEFEVVAFPEDSLVRVIVKNGRVALRQKKSDVSTGTVLSSRDGGELNGAGLLTVRSGLDLQEELSWLERRLVFKSVSVRKVVGALERWHDIKIEVRDDKVVDQLITVEFGDQTAAEIITQLAAVLNLQLRTSEHGDVFRLY